MEHLQVSGPLKHCECVYDESMVAYILAKAFLGSLVVRPAFSSVGWFGTGLTYCFFAKL